VCALNIDIKKCLYFNIMLFYLRARTMERDPEDELWFLLSFFTTTVL